MWLRIYEIFWYISAIFLFPVTLKKDKELFQKRWAIELPRPSLKQNIWIHALSVGEVLSSIPLVEKLREKCHLDIIFTVTTKKGMEIALKNLEGKVKLITFFPFDFPFSVRRFVERISPYLFILVETDVWPFLMRYLSSKGIKSFLVNGRISPKSNERYRRFSWIAKDVFNCFELCMVQSEEEKEKLLELGINKEKVIDTGNIKFDRKIEHVKKEEKNYWRRIFRIKENDLVWISGSTHEGEEKIILEAYKRLREKVKNVKLIIAPRNIKRSEEVLKMAQDMGFKVGLRSKLKEEKEVVILDTIGELSKIYSISDIAFVGGSLVPFGGHNLLEPAAFGCPVLFGPYVFNFQEIASLLEKEGAGITVKDVSDLYKDIFLLIRDSSLRKKMGKASLSFIEKNRGVTDKVISLIKERIDEDKRRHT